MTKKLNLSEDYVICPHCGYEFHKDLGVRCSDRYKTSPGECVCYHCVGIYQLEILEVFSTYALDGAGEPS